MKTLLKHRTLIALLAAGMSVTSAQAATQMDKLSKELNIMHSILSTSLKQNNSNKGIRFRELDATYLAGQGVVFEVNTSSNGWSFSFGNAFSEAFAFSTNSAPNAPEAPEIMIRVDENEIEDMVRQAKRVAEKVQDQLRDLREDERELSWEQREYERRRRDIEFEKRHADDNRRKSLDKKLKELEQENSQLVKRKEEIAKFAAQLEEEQKQEAQKREKARQAQYKRFLSGFEESIASTLCNYGAGLKAMDSNEHVSFVLKNFAADKGHSGKGKDRIYVFSQKDVRACVTEKIDSDKLLTNAKTYLF